MRVFEVVRTFLMPLTEGVRPWTVAFCLVANSVGTISTGLLTDILYRARTELISERKELGLGVRKD